MKVTFIHSNNIGDQKRVQYRCRNVAEAIHRTVLNSAYLLDYEDFIQYTKEAQKICEQSDLLIFHRHLYGNVLPVVQSWKARGKKILVDIDEAPDLLTPDMKSYRFWKMGIVEEDRFIEGMFSHSPIQPNPLEQFRRGLRLVDAAITPSARLADDWNQTVKTFHIPDYLNTDHYLVVRQNPGDVINIGVGGCSMTSADLLQSGVLTALGNVCLRHPDVAVFFFDTDETLVQSSSIPAPQCTVVNNVPMHEWPSVLSKMNIGLIPVEGMVGIRASILRAVEYNVMKIPWLASDLPPYRELKRYGWLIPNTAERWETAVLEVIDHLDAYRSEASGEPFFFALSQDVCENIGKILSTFEYILNS